VLIISQRKMRENEILSGPGRKVLIISQRKMRENEILSGPGLFLLYYYCKLATYNLDANTPTCAVKTLYFTMIRYTTSCQIVKPCHFGIQLYSSFIVFFWTIIYKMFRRWYYSNICYFKAVCSAANALYKNSSKLQ